MYILSNICHLLSDDTYDNYQRCGFFGKPKEWYKPGVCKGECPDRWTQYFETKKKGQSWKCMQYFQHDTKASETCTIASGCTIGTMKFCCNGKIVI